MMVEVSWLRHGGCAHVQAAGTPLSKDHHHLVGVDIVPNAPSACSPATYRVMTLIALHLALQCPPHRPAACASMHIQVLMKPGLQPRHDAPSCTCVNGASMSLCVCSSSTLPPSKTLGSLLLDVWAGWALQRPRVIAMVTNNPNMYRCGGKRQTRRLLRKFYLACATPTPVPVVQHIDTSCQRCFLTPSTRLLCLCTQPAGKMNSVNLCMQQPVRLSTRQALKQPVMHPKMSLRGTIRDCVGQHALARLSQTTWHLSPAGAPCAPARGSIQQDRKGGNQARGVSRRQGQRAASGHEGRLGAECSSYHSLACVCVPPTPHRRRPTSGRFACSS